MKWIVALVALVTSSYAFAEGNCPNLNGVYKMNNTGAIRFTQNECHSVSLAYGYVQEDGRVEWHKSAVRVQLNGPETCGTFGCVKATSDAQQIAMTRDNPWTGENEHGVCDFNYVSYSLNAQGALVSKQKAFNCQDGFSGYVEVVQPRLN